ncbi:MAG: ATP-binding cassette domain-containing protein [Lachnospiraceae bacterium]|nr:ATP-binding cassette domain-containing protein [Lachnospiraceae bacterium]
MAQISVSNLTFCYEGSFDNIFENVSFLIDTDWKLGFIGRNGKGKTTFLNLLTGKLGDYQGHISTSTVFDYFPYHITEGQMEQCFAEFMDRLKPECELWRVICELEKLHLEAETLYRPFRTLSHGERTKVMLAILFSGENDFLLIDEPTNHLDQESRDIVKKYLQQKKGFILVSHDRDLLDACIDHVLVLNRCTIEVQSGNFSSWWENKNRMDSFHEAENEKHRREIRRLNRAAERTQEWADKNERTKIGYDPVKEHDRSASTRTYIGAKTKKMQSRRMQIEKRIADEIEQKEGLLQDIERPADLKVMPMQHHKEVLIAAKDYGIAYCVEQKGDDAAETGRGNCKQVFRNLDFELKRGERVFFHGENGCGKSSLIKAILARCAPENSDADKISSMRESGALTIASGLIVSYINQDTSHLRGSLRQYSRQNSLDESLFLAILRQLDLERVQFVKNMEEYSEGQKKKVLIAASLLKPAHLYIWDEPLNYIDVFSRMQIENLLLTYQPTMLIVEHDVRFREKIATRVVEM